MPKFDMDIPDELDVVTTYSILAKDEAEALEKARLIHEARSDGVQKVSHGPGTEAGAIRAILYLMGGFAGLSGIINQNWIAAIVCAVCLSGLASSAKRV